MGERIIDFHVQPLRGLDGEVIYVIGTGIDVTERVRPE
jgi:PAS domain-containing protein